MKARFGVRRRTALAVTAVAAIVVSAVPVPATADAAGQPGSPDHWGVITRDTIGSPVADLRPGPFGSFGLPEAAARPPYGRGSLGISVADRATSLTPPSEAVHFGNETDFYGIPVPGLRQVGFHVFQTGENISYGGPGNMPNIRFEIDPNLAAARATTYSSMVWNPPPSPVVDQWSPYLDATRTGTWYLTGSAGAAARCSVDHPCGFRALLAALNDGGAQPVVYTAGVSKGRDYMWNGAVDGLRINDVVYDFEPDGVQARRAG
ncbi:hypothetical protein ABZ646_04130 [Streptomyces sp. NPDC007162]|uniref:hypothetical protein n=1 Tax=Streptomyces sp. NPDC007162 TaxID=3156917 RepID=UPI0033ECA8A6